MSDRTDLSDLKKALDPFARVWRLNERLQPDLDAGMSRYLAGVWPTMADCKAASDLLERLGYQFGRRR